MATKQSEQSGERAGGLKYILAGQNLYSGPQMRHKPDKMMVMAVFILRDEKGRTSYAVAGNKDTRNEFRRFMASYPDRYDYVKAQVCVV